VITSYDRLCEAMAGRAGTWVVPGTDATTEFEELREVHVGGE